MINNFIPSLWAGGLLRALEKALIFGQPGVVNRDYEGEIQEKGDTVKIVSIGAVTVSDYARNTDLATPQTLQDAAQTLTISQQKAYNFYVDDLDAVQAAGGIFTKGMEEAAYALRNTADRYIASLYTGVNSRNYIGSDASPKTISAATDMYPFLVDLKTILDEANVPDTGRYCVLPPFAEGLMLKDDRFVRTPQLNADTILNGEVAQAAGFSILLSNNLTHNGAGDLPASGDVVRIMAGHAMAITYAEQITKTEAYRPERRFGDALKGLHVYGGKMVRSEAMAVLALQRP